MTKTKIQWTDETWNPLLARNVATGDVGWACEQVSPGCANCYAESYNLLQRFKRKDGTVTDTPVGTGLPYAHSSRGKVEHFLDEDVLRAPLRWKKPRKVFVCDMTDLFGEWVPDEHLDRMFAVMALTPHITYQVLTKRPERMREYLSGAHNRVASILRAEWVRTHEMETFRGDWSNPADFAFWPLPNVWLGTTVENQEQADLRIPHLLATPAAVRFLSVEPMLGPVSLVAAVDLFVDWLNRLSSKKRAAWPNEGGIDWVIVGGESGSGARPFDLAWARDIVRQCQSAGVAVFVKQLGAKPRIHFRDQQPTEFPGDLAWAGTDVNPPVASPDREEDWWKPVLKDRHGGEWDEWPADLRVRQWPGGEA